MLHGTSQLYSFHRKILFGCDQISRDIIELGNNGLGYQLAIEFGIGLVLRPDSRRPGLGCPEINLGQQFALLIHPLGHSRQRRGKQFEAAARDEGQGRVSAGLAAFRAAVDKNRSGERGAEDVRSYCSVLKHPLEKIDLRGHSFGEIWGILPQETKVTAFSITNFSFGPGIRSKTAS